MAKVKKKKRIGQVVSAHWDERLKGVRFTVSFEEWGIKISGTCKSGMDPQTGSYISPSELKEKINHFYDMAVYDETGEYTTGGKPDYEKLKKIKFKVSLRSKRIGMDFGEYKPNMNTFIRYL